jgi:hypothetical protein
MSEKNCVSAHELNDKYFFNIGLNEYSIEFQNQNIPLYVFRPINMADVKEVIIHIPGRNGNAKEYIEQTTLMNAYNTRLAVCVEMSQFNVYEFEFGNIFTEKDFNAETSCLNENTTLSASSTWTFNIIFTILDFLKEKLQKTEIDYVLNGIDAGGGFVQNMNFWFPLIENPNKQYPKTSIIGVASFYFFLFSKSRMRLDYITNVDTSKTATKTYKELINYNHVKKNCLNRKNEKLIKNLKNENALESYYEYINNFFQYFKNPINRNVQDITNKNVYDLSDNMSPQIYPVGIQNLPLSASQLQLLQKEHCKQHVIFQFYEKDTNIYGGVTETGENIPNLVTSCTSASTGKFRLFRGMNAWFSTKIDARKKNYEFNWQYVVIPNCGHSSNFSNTTLLMSNMLDPDFWKNPRFCPEFFYFLKPELFE